MKTFQDFLENHIQATSYGYEALLIDYWSLWCHSISIVNVKRLAVVWKEIFTDYCLLALPLQLLKVTSITILFLSIPLMFPIYGLISYLFKNKWAKREKENRERAMLDL